MVAKNSILGAAVSIIILLLIISFFSIRVGYCKPEVWTVHDTITPTVDSVKWLEEGSINTPPSWISSGLWITSSMRQSLVAENDIFVSTYEMINWTLMKPYVSNLYEVNFGSFDAFNTALESNASRWIDLSWGIDSQWYGVSSTQTKIVTSYNSSNSLAELWIWFHITRIPEYLVGEKAVETWLTGFDLTPISIGSLQRWEFSEDWDSAGIYYKLMFEAPANILTQEGDIYTLTVDVSSNYRGYSYDVDQTIELIMPSGTEVTDGLQSIEHSFSENTATFTIKHGQIYPESYTVVSGPPSRTISEAFFDALRTWLLTPAGWATIASISVLIITGLKGRIVWKRNSTYHRLYKSMVKVHDVYSKEQDKFKEEMDNAVSSIFKLLIEDKITDDQFEKLLKLRDELITGHIHQTQKNQ